MLTAIQNPGEHVGHLKVRMHSGHEAVFGSVSSGLWLCTLAITARVSLLNVLMGRSAGSIFVASAICALRSSVDRCGDAKQSS